jgi:hypothetical protein
VHDVVDIVPEVVIFADMSREATLRLLVKCKSLKVANVALIVLIGVHEVLLLSKLSKSINDNTEQNVVEDNLHQ